MTSLPWLDVAESLLGTHEIPGPKSNPVIVEWAKAIGGNEARYYTNDDIPWCALFLAHCLTAEPSNCDLSAVDNKLWCPSYMKYGTKCKPVYGCIMNFGYHIAFYISEDANYYYVLGGNQSNTVNVTRIPKGNLKRACWPTDKLDLLVDGPVQQSSNAKGGTTR